MPLSGVTLNRLTSTSVRKLLFDSLLSETIESGSAITMNATNPPKCEKGTEAVASPYPVADTVSAPMKTPDGDSNRIGTPSVSSAPKFRIVASTTTQSIPPNASAVILMSGSVGNVIIIRSLSDEAPASFSAIKENSSVVPGGKGPTARAVLYWHDSFRDIICNVS